MMFNAPLPPAQKPLVVCIDPGHPSEVGRGTQGRRVTEIQVAWRVAKLLQQDLQGMNVRVVLTKQSENQFVRNRKRAETANNAHADLMVRLHCDAASGSGFTTYYPDQRGTAEGFTGPSRDLLTREAPIAHAFQSVLAQELKGFLKSNGLKGDEYTAVGAQHGALIGSIFSKVPVVLVEMVVLTNPKDEQKVRTQEGCGRLAKALAKASMAAIQASK